MQGIVSHLQLTMYVFAKVTHLTIEVIDSSLASIALSTDFDGGSFVGDWIADIEGLLTGLFG